MYVAAAGNFDAIGVFKETNSQEHDNSNVTRLRYKYTFELQTLPRKHR